MIRLSNGHWMWPLLSEIDDCLAPEYREEAPITSFYGQHKRSVR
jgi:hypothetical protein